MRAHLVLLAAAGLALAGAGCFIEDGRHCTDAACGVASGELGFFWAFGLPGGGHTDDCLLADVARVDVRVYDDATGRLEFEALGRPCQEQGAWITDFWPGDYVLELRASCRLGGVGHEGWFDLRVWEGLNDFGVLVLEPVGGCP